MATSNIINTLGAGSGIDTQKLAKDLMEATREPRKAIIDQKITQSEARISGYAVVKFSIGELKNAFSNLNDLSDFASLQTTNSQPTALSVMADAAAQAGSYQVNVNQVAQAQRITSVGFTDISQTLNQGESFELALSINGAQSQAISVTDATPSGIVSAINSSALGLTAQLIQTSGDAPWKIIVTGEEGLENAFTLSSSVDLGFDDTNNAIQSSQNAIFSVNGVSIERSSNSIDDVIEGVTFNLATVTTNTARIDLVRDASSITSKIETLVTTYNEFEENLKILSDRTSEVEEYGGVLAGDTLLQNIRNKVRAMLTDSSSTPGSTITAPRDIGLTFNRDGVLEFDKDKLSTQLQTNFDEVALMFSANTNNQSFYSTANGGIAGDAVKTLESMLLSTGDIALKTENASKQVAAYKSDLEKLEEKMQKLLDRYIRQFTAMESIVGNSNSLRESLKGTFEGLANMYKK